MSDKPLRYVVEQYLYLRRNRTSRWVARRGCRWRWQAEAAARRGCGSD